jgi:hypothetical protein
MDRLEGEGIAESTCTRFQTSKPDFSLVHVFFEVSDEQCPRSDGAVLEGKPPSAVDVIVSKRPVVRCLKRHPAIQRNNKKSTSTITKLSIEESYSKSPFCYVECGGVINS